MGSLLNKLNGSIEKLGILGILTIFILAYPIFPKKLSYEFPSLHGTVDNLWFDNFIVQAVKSENLLKKPYFMSGVDSLHAQPMLFFSSIYLISKFTNIQPWNLEYGFILLLMLFSSILFFFFLYNFNKKVAFLSLPCLYLLWTLYFSLGVLWGQWMDVTGLSFLVVSLYFYSLLVRRKIEINKKICIFLSLLVAGMISSHLEYLYFIFTIMIWIAGNAILDRKNFLDDKHNIRLISLFVLSFVFGILFAFDNFFRVMMSFGKGAGKLVTFKPILGKRLGAHEPSFFDFGILAPIIALGVFFSFIYIWQKRKIPFEFSAGFCSLIVGFGNFFGFSKYYEPRFYWPLFLSIFFGYCLYILLSSIRKIDWKYILPASFIISILVVIIFFGKVPTPFTLVTKYDWEIFKWISKNTDGNASILYLWGDNWYQDKIFWYGERKSYLIDRNNFIKGNLVAKFVGECGVRRKGILYKSVCPHEFLPTEINISNLENFKNFDYIVSWKISSYPLITEKINKIIGDLIENNITTIIYQNKYIVVMKRL